MILYIHGHDFHYEMENLCRVFFPNEKVKVTDEHPADADFLVTTELISEYNTYRVAVKVKINGKEDGVSQFVSQTDEPIRDECERTMARVLFRLLSHLTGYTPPWGILTGVRPSKLMIRLVEKYGEDGAHRYFTDNLLVTDKKTRLALSVAKTEKNIKLNFII